MSVEITEEDFILIIYNVLIKYKGHPYTHSTLYQIQEEILHEIDGVIPPLEYSLEWDAQNNRISINIL